MDDRDRIIHISDVGEWNCSDHRNCLSCLDVDILLLLCQMRYLRCEERIKGEKKPMGLDCCRVTFVSFGARGSHISLFWNNLQNSQLLTSLARQRTRCGKVLTTSKPVSWLVVYPQASVFVSLAAFANMH
jgi:hypothetical protein